VERQPRQDKGGGPSNRLSDGDGPEHHLHGQGDTCGTLFADVPQAQLVGGAAGQRCEQSHHRAEHAAPEDLASDDPAVS